MRPQWKLNEEAEVVSGGIKIRGVSAVHPSGRGAGDLRLRKQSAKAVGEIKGRPGRAEIKR